jgi:hypothetical protein
MQRIWQATITSETPIPEATFCLLRSGITRRIRHPGARIPHAARGVTGRYPSGRGGFQGLDHARISARYRGRHNQSAALSP